MDLGLDYFRVLLALGFVSGWFCLPKSAWPVGVSGVSRQAFSAVKISGFSKRWVAVTVTGHRCFVVKGHLDSPTSLIRAEPEVGLRRIWGAAAASGGGSETGEC